MGKSVPPHLLVERALALVPDFEEFLPLADAVIGASRVDSEKVWARSGEYSTLGKRVVDPGRLDELLPVLLEKSQQRLRELFGLVHSAIREQRGGNLAGAVELLVRAGEMEEAEQRLEKAESIYHMALDLCQELRETAPHALVLRRLGRTARTAGRLDAAWERYEQSYELAVDGMDVPGQVIACQGLGNVCDDRGERERARLWWERGLERAAGLEQPELEWPFYTNLSVLTMLEGDLAEAERLLGRARDCIERTGAPGAMLYWQNNRGLLLLEHGDVAGAETVFRDALQHCRNEPHWEMVMRINRGECLMRQGRLFEAGDEARRAEEIAIRHRFVPDLVDVYALLGSIARERCDDEGFVFYEQALQVCRERGVPAKLEAGVLHGYGRLHSSCGRPEEGRGYLEAARDTFASLGLIPELAQVEDDLARLLAVPFQIEADPAPVAGAGVAEPV
ncbi:MAG TPA: tetratricopeptide repeat protein [Longimicrobium sp.]|nr:tetratricopeptide repeat protein [Longimicrobium sp.]